MNIKAKKWAVLIFVLIGGILYIGNSLSNKNDTESISTFKENKNDIHRWSSKSPQYIMDEATAEVDINNIKAIQKEGWKLLIQNGEPISFSGKLSGRNEIIEQSATNLLQGGYELFIDNDGNIVDIQPNEDAEGLLEKQQKEVQIEQNQKQQEQQQSDHDIQHNIIQNNITDINRYMENGYRFKISNDDDETIMTWNINNHSDTSPSLNYSISKLISYGIKVKTDVEGKVIGFDFSQTDFSNDKFDVYGMTR